MQGTVKWFDAEKGYGFIRPDDDDGSDGDVFVHWSGISESAADETGRRNLHEGQAVEFATRPGRKGVEAFDVLPLA